MFEYLDRGVACAGKPPIDFDDIAERALALSRLTHGSIPLFQWRDGQPIGVATGTLVEIGERSLLVTAWHFVRDLRGDGVVVPISETEGHSLGGRSASNRGIDVSVIELEPQDVEALGRRYSRLRLSDIHDFRTPLLDEFLICGYPWERQQVGAGGGTIRALAYRGVGYRGPHPDSLDVLWETPFQEDIDFLVHFAEQGYGVDGRRAPVPALAGMSGSSLWCITPGLVPSALRVIGVQTAVWPSDWSKRTSGWVRSTLWAPIAGFIAQQWPDLRELLGQHFAEGQELPSENA